MSYTVEYSTQFIQDFGNNVWGFAESDLDKIADFVAHIQQYGFTGLEGRNKKSDDVRDVTKKVYAQQHNLWHYHIGILQYDTSKPVGKRTSRYVVHYQFDYSGASDVVRIVDVSDHSPFTLPSTNALA